MGVVFLDNEYTNNSINNNDLIFTKKVNRLNKYYK